MSERFSPERIALAALATGAVLVCLSGLAIPVGYALVRLGVIESPNPSATAWVPPPPPPGVPAIAPARTATSGSDSVIDVDFDGDGANLYVLLRGGVVRRVDCATGAIAAQGFCDGSAARIHHAADADMVVALSPGRAEFLDGRSLAHRRPALIVQQWPGVTNMGFCPPEVVSPSGRWMFGMGDGASGGKLGFWDLESGARTMAFGPKDSWQSTGCYLSNGEFVAVASDAMDSSSHFQYVVDPGTETVRGPWKRIGVPNPTFIVPDGKGGTLQLSTAGIHRLDPATGVLTLVATPTTTFWNAAMTSDGRLVFDPNTGIVHDIATNSQVAWLPYMAPASIEFSPDDGLLARGGYGGEVEIYDMRALPTRGVAPTPAPTPRPPGSDPFANAAPHPDDPFAPTPIPEATEPPKD